MDAEVRELFARSVDDATKKHTGAALDRALTDVGWHDALAADRREAIEVLFSSQGAVNAASTALGAVLVDALGVDGDSTIGVVLPVLGAARPPAVREGPAVVVNGVALAPRERMLVVVDDGDKGAAAAVIDGNAIDVRPVQGIDPALGLHHVQGTAAIDATLSVDWTGAMAVGRRAVAHELGGASRAMLELAREHALEREQFGRPIAQFQAVRHRLAETLVAVEAAAGLLDAAWVDDSPVSAAMAKATAGRSARTAARHCQQVLAGIGFTTEHPFHGYFRRVLVLDQLLGSSKVLTRELGRDLLTTRRLPVLLPL